MRREAGEKGSCVVRREVDVGSVSDCLRVNVTPWHWHA